MYDAQVTKRMQDSAAVLVVLSPDYLASAPCLFQFGQAYNHMVARRQGDLVLIKLGNDAMPRRAVGGEPRLRAMLSMNMFYAASDDGKLDKALDSLVAEVRVDNPAPY